MDNDNQSKMGRPKITLNWDQLEKLCALPKVITNEEIAWIMGISKDTIERRIREKHDVTFAAYRDQKGCVFKQNLLSKQFQVAMSGNVSMLIWLGKQYLGQVDKRENTFGEGESGKLIIDLSGDHKDG